MTEAPPLDRRRIGSFLAIALGIAALTGGVLYATGGLESSPELLPGITLATVLLPTVYMFSPAVANVATRSLTDEGWTDLSLRPNLPDRWRAYVAAWLGTSALIGAGFALSLALQQAGVVPPASDGRTLPMIAILASLTLGPVINTFVAFGEEFGWRAYLLQKLMPLGVRRALFVHGVIWGVWHWPVIAMGYNYGLDYPGAPWTGLAMMTVATVAIGTVLGTLALWADSVWPPALAHGTLNAVGSVAAVVGGGASLVSAAPVALVGVVPWAVVAVVIRYRWTEAMIHSARGA
ncbi:CPBP family intramembrane metalloprotease domain-containing protein [Halobacteriales archaeon QS_4_62_28]|nr:MAG: CPBP family intramembrane metalloprotease domain-containing protein [Halobacteriales archaeon QS_4_62_28]